MEPNSFSLSQLQNWMQGMLVKPTSLPDSGFAGQPTITDIVNPSRRLSAVRHLDIYRYSYIARLRACMHSQFKALAYALGDELFESFADLYLDTYPSESHTLNTLGEKFPVFLEETRPDAGQEHKEVWPDFMIELARFEYELSLIFDEQAVAHDRIIPVDTPDGLLKIAPVFHLFHHQFPVCSYYLEFSQGMKPELPFPAESYCAVTRLNYKLGLFTLRGAQYYFLKSMQEGRSVKEAKRNLVNSFNFNSLKLDDVWPQWKKSFIAAGFFTTGRTGHKIV